MVRVNCKGPAGYAGVFVYWGFGFGTFNISGKSID